MDLKEYSNIVGWENWISIEPLNKGFSGDRKYTVIDKEGNKFLLRVSNIELYQAREKQFHLLKKVESLNIEASKAISFGKLNDNEVYTLLTWLEGVDAETYVAALEDSKAYELGVETGKILKKLHQIPVEADKEDDWYKKFKSKMQRKYKAIEECELELKNKDMIIKYIEEHMYLVKNRKQTFSHGDYHLGNLIANNGKIGVIDFDKNKIADPYDDFKPFIWNASVNEYFETGFVNGYFNNNIPEDFFPILALYAAENLLSYLPWAAKAGEKALVSANRVYDNIMRWYDNLNLVIPTWYKGIIEQK